MPGCCVPFCNNRSGGERTYSFHRFPAAKEKRQQWLKMIRRDDFTPTANTRVCSWHFADGLVAGPTRFHWNLKETTSAESPVPLPVSRCKKKKLRSDPEDSGLEVLADAAQSHSDPDKMFDSKGQEIKECTEVDRRKRDAKPMGLKGNHVAAQSNSNQEKMLDNKGQEITECTDVDRRKRDANPVGQKGSHFAAQSNSNQNKMAEITESPDVDRRKRNVKLMEQRGSYVEPSGETAKKAALLRTVVLLPVSDEQFEKRTAHRNQQNAQLLQEMELLKERLSRNNQTIEDGWIEDGWIEEEKSNV